MAVNGGHAGTKKGPNWGHVTPCGSFHTPPTFQKSGRAKGAAKGSCGETVVQKGVFGESVSSLLP